MVFTHFGLFLKEKFKMSVLTSAYCVKTFGEPKKAEAKWCQVWTSPAIFEIPTIPKRIYMHKYMIPYWNKVYKEICLAGLGHLIKIWNGCFNIRLMTGSKTKWSLHAWGLAVDFNAHENPFGKTGKMDMRIVKIFEANGFTWGGKWKKPDPMHFELTLESIKNLLGQSGESY